MSYRTSVFLTFLLGAIFAFLAFITNVEAAEGLGFTISIGSNCGQGTNPNACLNITGATYTPWCAFDYTTESKINAWSSRGTWSQYDYFNDWSAHDVVFFSVDDYATACDTETLEDLITADWEWGCVDVTGAVPGQWTDVACPTFDFGGGGGGSGETGTTTNIGDVYMTFAGGVVGGIIPVVMVFAILGGLLAALFKIAF